MRAAVENGRHRRRETRRLGWTVTQMCKKEMALGPIRSDLERVFGSPDLTAQGFLGLPGSLRQFLWWIILGRAVTCERIAQVLGETEREARNLVSDLTSRGLVEQVPACGFPVYRVCLNPRRLRPPEELLNALGTKTIPVGENLPGDSAGA